MREATSETRVGGGLVWRTLLSLSGAIWWGGLTFYAAVVVPLGANVVGSLSQGLITQRVTWWHNALTWVFVVVVLCKARFRRSVGLATSGGLIAVLNVALTIWHARLSDMISPNAVAEGFYQSHAVYLWITTAQWLVGLAVMGLLNQSPSDNKNQ